MPHVQQLQVTQCRTTSGLRRRAGRAHGVSRPATVGFCLGGCIVPGGGRRPGRRRRSASTGSSTTGSACPGRSTARPRSAARCSGCSAGPTRRSRVEDVEQFDPALSDAGVEHEIHVYPGAPHSFFDRRAAEHADASEDAWRRMLGFLDVRGDRLIATSGSSRSSSSRLSTLPVGLRGSSSMNTTSRGTL